MTPSDGKQGSRPDEAAGGDPVCWAHLLCPECSAVPDRPEEERCPRCGAELPPSGDP